MCELSAGSGFEDEAKNFRPEDRLLGALGWLGRRLGSFAGTVEAIIFSVVPCSSRCLDLCSKLIVLFSTRSRTEVLSVCANSA